MVRHYLAVGVFAALSSCGRGTDTASASPQDETRRKSGEAALVLEEATKPPGKAVRSTNDLPADHGDKAQKKQSEGQATKGDLKFLRKKEGLVQTLSIKRDGESKVAYTLAVEGKCRRKISGVAEGRPNDDPEIDEDEDGVGYPATQYTHHHEAGLIQIRLAFDESKARVQSGLKGGCSVSSGLMKRAGS